MPAPLQLRLQKLGENVVVSYGGRVLACYECGDRGMRNLAIVALTRAGVSGVEAAELFGIRPEHVSRLRRQVSEGGSRELLPVMGRPRKLDASAISRAYELSDEGLTGREIAGKLGVSKSTISRLLAGRPAPAPERLALQEADAGSYGDGAEVSDNAEVNPSEVSDGNEVTGPGVSLPVVAENAEVSDSGEVPGNGEANVLQVSLSGDAETRIVQGGGRSVYAGAMLLYPFLEKVGAEGVLGALHSGPARHYDTSAVALAATFAFALGSSSLEGSKHLQLADAGLLLGAERFPHLRTLRPRLAALADAADPLALQVALSKAMLAADPEPPVVFFVDEHFVAYTGSRPVAKGWNTRRRHAEPGRHETVIVDDSWRAICFASGPPQGLASGMLHPVDQLQAICGDRSLMVGFDRGGAYPQAFTELRDRGIDWVTYRRAPLAAPTVKPQRSWVVVDGHRRYMRVADELVDLKGYGSCRQLSVYEHGKVALQILTSELNSPAAALAYTLRCRWRVENAFKYLEEHHGLHWLCDYEMSITPDTRLVRNPQRTKALAHLRAREAEVAELERQIGALSTTFSDTATDNDEQTLVALHEQLQSARAEVKEASAALKPVPANLPANTIDPAAQCATPKINRRALQTVCRLLAYNAELDLARALNTYLTDPDEYRAITRHLLHQPGQIHYTKTGITVTIDPPPAPRIRRALKLLIEQTNHNPPKLPGDQRRITYQTTPAP